MAVLDRTEKINTLIRSTERKLRHAKNRVTLLNKREKPVQNKMTELTYHAGWDKGYWEGRVAILEDTLDDLYDLAGIIPNHVLESKIS